MGVGVGVEVSVGVGVAVGVVVSVGVGVAVSVGVVAVSVGVAVAAGVSASVVVDRSPVEQPARPASAAAAARRTVRRSRFRSIGYLGSGVRVRSECAFTSYNYGSDGMTVAAGGTRAVPVAHPSDPFSTFAATRTGSHTGLNGGA